MYPTTTSQILASNLLANNTVIFQAELHAGASLMRAAPVCRPPKVGRARPRVPLQGHALSPKSATRSKLSNFRPQEPLRSPTELKPYIFREPPRGSSNHYLTLRLKARSSHACVQPPQNFCPHMARKVVRMPLPRLGRALEDVRIKNAAVARLSLIAAPSVPLIN